MQEMKQNKILRVPKAAFLADSRFTRVFSKYSEFEDWDNEELILEKMDHLFFTEAKNATKAVGEVVNEFDWNK